MRPAGPDTPAKMYYAQNMQAVRIVTQRVDTALRVGTHLDGAVHAADNRDNIETVGNAVNAILDN
jgi:kynurenine formamidase